MKKMILAAGALLGAALAHTSCQAPAPLAPKAEPIAAGHPTAARKPAPAQSTKQPVAQQKALVRQAPPIPLGFTPFLERPHLRKVKYGKRRWVLV